MVSIKSNIAALQAQNNLRTANAQVTASVAKLSSGNRIIRASDDVAGLALGTVLSTTVSTLRTALTQANQANSLLGIADGGLQNISDILARQKSLAVQATSGTLTDTERGFLNQEFQALITEIDQLTGDTIKFNNTKLLDGSLANSSDIATNTTSKGAAASGTITLSGAGSAQDYVTINGVNVYLTADGGGDTVQIGGNQTATATNLLTYLNSTTFDALKEFDYSRSAAVITITAKQTGTIGNITLTDGLSAGTVANLSGGSDGDIAASATVTSADVQVNTSDLVGDSILNGTTVATTAKAFSVGTVNFNTNVTSNDTITIAGVVFNAGTDFAVGGNGTASALNLAVAVAQSSNPALKNIAASSSGVVTTLTFIEGEGGAGFNGTAITASANATDTDFASGAGDSAVYVNNIANNAAFTGIISGFKATYLSDDKVTLEIKVGDETYTGTVDDTTPGRDTVVRLTSVDSGVDGGGFFEITLNSGSGETVTTQTQADVFAARIDAAFSNINFYQRRDVSTTSYSGVGNIFTGSTQTGTLANSSFDFTLANFGNVEVQDVTVAAPASGATDGKITIKLSDGRIFETASGLTDDINDNTTVTLTSTTNPKEQIFFTVGAGGLGSGTNEAIQFENVSQAASFEAALEKAFGIGSGGGGITFQVGTTAKESITVSIASAKTAALYKDSAGVTQTLTIATAAGATTASTTLDLAITALTSTISDVGALQSRFDFAAAALESAIQNTDAAAGDFLNADVAAESTSFATAQVTLQAGISVLAQANLLQQNLLKLIG